tara:strand:+ start:321 stop:506 length:186 start_codon:yes stop_codon:yes gene_type:complete
MTTESLNNFSITDADMQTILDDLGVDMQQILAGLNFDIDSTLNILAHSVKKEKYLSLIKKG